MLRLEGVSHIETTSKPNGRSDSQLQISDLNKLPLGTQVTADDIAPLSRQNKIKGIHPLLNLEPRSVVILCTLNGKSYPNKWVDSDKSQLKYYLEGRTDKRTEIKHYNPDIASNKAVVTSRQEGYPIHVFVREKTGIPFKYEGQFLL